MIFSDCMPIALGSVLYGPRLSGEETARQLSLFTELGGTWVDTARVYGAWAPGGYEGYTEELVGRWLRVDGHRDQVMVCTKGAHPAWQVWLPRVTPEAIRSDLEQSLRNLCTDRVELYLLHRDDPTQPIAPILETLEDLRREGKLLHYGCSNWTLPRMREAAAVAEREGWEGFVANQAMWSMMKVNADAVEDKTLVCMDDETLAWQAEKQMGLMAYTSLAHGYLMKRIAGRMIPEGLLKQYDNAANRAAEKLIREQGADPLALSLRYIALCGASAMPVVAFSGDEQLRSAMTALTDNRWDDLLNRLRSLMKEA